MSHEHKRDSEPCRNWMLARLEEQRARFDWSKLPSDFEFEAVTAIWKRDFYPFFRGDKRLIRQRIAASKAQTFDELRAAIEALP